MPDPNDKALIASSEFDPKNFISGIDAMTGALQKLSDQEDVLRGDLKNINTALVANRTELKTTEDQIKNLDKTSASYQDTLKKLTTQQETLKTQQKDLRDSLTTHKTSLNEVNTAAIKYKDAIAGISAISKQVASENKGRTLFDVASLNQQIQQVTQLGGKLRNVFQGKISTDELDHFEQTLAGTKDEFQQLAQVITFVKSKMDTLDPKSQDFEDLSKIIEIGDSVLEQYGKTVQNVDTKTVSLRGQLSALKTQLVQLEEQGKDNTKEFEDLQLAAGKLQDKIGDAQRRIQVLSSDTKNLDFGIGAIRGIASAFGIAEGAAALFGVKNEEMVASIQRLTAIMTILNGLQEIQNLLQKQSVVSIVGQEIATKGAAIATRIYAIAVGTSVGAMKAFRIALLATGIGAFVVLIGLAAEAMGLFGDSTKEATDFNKEFNDSLEDSILILDSHTRFIKTNAAIREESIKRTSKQSKDELANLKDQAAIDNKIQASKIQALQDERAELRKPHDQIRENQTAFLDAGKTGDFIEKSNQQATALFNRIMDIDDQIRIEKEKNLTKTFEDNRKALEKQRQLYESYLERLTQLQRQLRDKLLAANPQDEAAIRETFRNSLADALADLDKDVADKKLTRGRATVLKNLVKQINDVDLKEGLKEFRKDSEKAQADLDNSIYDIRIKSGQERAELIRDQFTREAAVVRAEARNSATTLKRERDDLIKNINETRDQGLISPQAALQNVERVKLIYEQLLENLATQTSRKQEEITARTFEAAQNQLQAVFTNVGLFVSESATAEIQKVTQKFLSGKITYEKYQKELTKITQQESTRRIATVLRENEALLAGVQARLKLEADPERRKALEDQERQLRQTISDLKRQLAGADAEGTKADHEERNQRIQQLAAYAGAIGGIINQVVSFWAQANEAEQRSLEKSIALQQTRVDAATKLAERGNAEYLRLEEDRLNELQVKQENAARRQLAINAVIQTSQALTAFVTALAQGIATGGPLGGIAIAAAVIGLIASGYAIITSLQKNNTPAFWEGTKSVRRNGEPAGRDTIHAMLSEDEAVIPSGTNKAYRPAVEAIYDHTVPAEDMNAFVNSYRVNSRSLPRLDHDRLGEVANVVVTYDGQLLAATESQTKRMEEQNDLLRKVDKRLAAMGINVNIDRHGLAVALMKATEQFAIDKKS